MSCLGIVVAIKCYLFRSQDISQRSRKSRNHEAGIIQDVSRDLANRHGALKPIT